MPSLSPEDAALFATLPSELARALYPDQSAEPFRITVLYPALAGAAAQAAGKLETAAVSHQVEPPAMEGEPPMHRTTFSLQQVEEFHELYHLVENAGGDGNIELLLNGKAVPLARELWLPLLWTLRS